MRLREQKVDKKGDKEITDLPTDRLPTSALGPLAIRSNEKYNNDDNDSY
jgi:hypothetical protein